MAEIRLKEKLIAPRQGIPSAPAEIEDFSDLIAARSYAFSRLSELTGENWSWEHPRVKDFLARCGAKNHYHLPYGRYEFMVNAMLQMIREVEEVLIGRQDER